MIDTKTKILDTAERLIAEQGYAATSLRHIIAEAGVNLAAIHYHFGSKEDLLDQVILRKVEPLNRERLARLDRVEHQAAGAPTVKAILIAFLRPMAEMADRDPACVALMGRLIAEGLLPDMVERHFKDVSTRIVGALRRAAASLPEDEFAWRMQFLFGAMAHTMSGLNFPQHVQPSGDFRGRIERLITFVTAGFEAPTTRLSKPAEKAKSEER